MTTNTTIASDYALSDHSEEHLRIEPSLPLPGKLFLGIEDHSLDEDTQGTGRYVHIDPNKVRDAIDNAMGKREEEADWRDSDRVEVDWHGDRVVVGREIVGKHVGQWEFPDGLHYWDGAVARMNPKAVGKREKDGLFLEQASIYGQVAMHPVFDDCWTPDSTPSADAMIEKLDRLAEAEGNGTKVYPARHRDRHLRHIEDLEATLTRRNERHERDQERIRELEAEVIDLVRRYSEQGDKLLASYGSKTAREYLDLAWEATIAPEDGTIHAGEEFLCKDESGIRQPASGPSSHSFPAGLLGVERRLLDPRPKPSKEDSYRKELKSKGLAEWEIELLVGSAG